MQTASSARRTWSASWSAVEKTATLARPSSRQARIARSAISPRFATRTFCTRRVQKVLVANRGEIALRAIRACRELGLASVAVFSTADQDALHVRRADEAVCIGPPHARESYLNITAILQAARQADADAIYPGYGFLAENPVFAAACRDEELTFVGPSPDAIEAMGDKAEARLVAASAGVPTIPGTEGKASLDEALEVAAEIGYPVMVKAAAGGGGRG